MFKPKLLIVLTVLTLAACSAQTTQNPTSTPVPTTVQSPSSQPTTPAKTATPSSLINGEYTSYRLGLKFNLNQGEPEKAWIKEEETKIFVVPGTIKNYIEGQWLEEFTKDKNESVQLNIQKTILAHISTQDCFVVEETAQENLPANKPRGHKFFTINYPNSADPESWNSNMCPKEYSRTNGVRYFEYDPNHPDKYIYVDIGQYPIGSGIDEHKAWQDTLRFID